MPYLNLRPSQVALDPENPRLPDGTSNDREAINRLLDDGAEALVSLARDMARTGQTNPAELPIAIQDGNKYLILEGNRRFAALKLLKDPALADDEEHQKLFRRAAALGVPPKTVYTLVMSSREEADHWIVLRHTGENGGVGIKRWSAGQTATHRRRANKTIDSGTLRSIAIADELEEAYAADGELVELVRQTCRGKLTNIGRFFSPDVLATLHFSLKVDDNSSVRARSLLVRHSAGQLRDFFMWAFDYILNNPVDAYKNEQIRKAALQTVSHLLPSLVDAAAEPFRLVDATPVEKADSQPINAGGDGTSDGAKTGSEGGGGSSEGLAPHGQGETAEIESGGGVRENRSKSKHEGKPEKYLLQGLKLPNHPERIQRLLKECRSLNLEEFPGVACVMIRVVVELSVSSPEALSLSGASEGDSLQKKILNMLKYLDPQIESPPKRDKGLAQAYLEASTLGVQYLHGFVHNSSMYPDQHLARRFSGAFRPLLERVDGAL